MNGAGALWYSYGRGSLPSTTCALHINEFREVQQIILSCRSCHKRKIAASKCRTNIGTSVFQ